MSDVTVSDYMGICPICNVDNIQYEDCYIEDGYVVYPLCMQQLRCQRSRVSQT